MCSCVCVVYVCVSVAYMPDQRIEVWHGTQQDTNKQNTFEKGIPNKSLLLLTVILLETYENCVLIIIIMSYGRFAHVSRPQLIWWHIRVKLWASVMERGKEKRKGRDGGREMKRIERERETEGARWRYGEEDKACRRRRKIETI